MAADPIATGYALLYNTLTADATFMALVSGVYQEIAPAQVTTDYCLLINQSGTDVLSGVATRIMTTLLYQVKIVGPATDSANLNAAFARADALLQPNGQPLRNSGGTLACYREQTMTIGELDNSVLWRNKIGIYRIEV